MRIRHVIPAVGDSAPAELVAAQDLTLRSIERALRYIDADIDVDVRTVSFDNEVVDRPWVTPTPTLTRSVLDEGEFAVPRRLPLLSDVLAGLGDSDEYDVAILTNVDIAVQPFFYELVAEIVDEGHDAVTITRRTVQPRFRGSSMVQLSAAIGTAHPGHDCFVMAADVVDQLEPCDVALGVRWVARSLVWQLQLKAKNFRNIGGLAATFHVGDDRAWTDPRLVDYEEHNVAAAKQLVASLIEQFGRARVSRLLTIDRFITALDDDSAVETSVARAKSFPAETRPFAQSEPRLIFSANSGRAGSGFLAELLDAAPRIDAGHERPPRMVGGFTRRIAYEPRMDSYEDRLMKADALHAELRRMPAGSAYADTSHMFVKTFADVVFDQFQHERISVIVLRRDVITTAKSFFELDYFGPLPLKWYDWMIPPTVPQSAFPLDEDDIEDQFDLIFGYLVDIENRTARLRELAPDVQWIDTSLEDISQVEGARELFRKLRYVAPADLNTVVATPVNRKRKPKSKNAQPVSEARVRRRLQEFLQRHEHRRDLEPFVEAHGLEW